MEYIITGLRVSVMQQRSLRDQVQDMIGAQVLSLNTERASIDARRKGRITYVYSLRFEPEAQTPELRALLDSGKVRPFVRKTLPEPERDLTLPERPVIVGFGPAGMFAALELARHGHKPLVVERGQPVRRRMAEVKQLWKSGVLDPESNMQFGEGGAGTFSDGKLTTGKNNPLDRKILEDLVAAGAPKRILFDAKPHVGTDRLRRVVTSIRQEIESLGGQVRFGQRLDSIELDGNIVTGARVSGKRVATSALIMAIGHSARDTLAMLHESGVAMQPKPYAIGVRIEHPAGFINDLQYGGAAHVLGAADYRVSARYEGTGVYSFCMCPGGVVVCASSEPGGVVTNGMSFLARNEAYSNSGLVVGLTPERMGVTSAMEAVELQRSLEQAAFSAGGGGFVAPGQRASDYMSRRVSALPETTYRPGLRPYRLDDLLPEVVARGLAFGLRRFDRAMPGFVQHGLLIGVETRTSSPVQITRDERCESVSTQGLYLLGEGAGYAGGIMTCARDGLRFARRVLPRD